MKKGSKPQANKVPENMKWEGEANLKFMSKRHDSRFGDISIYKNERTGGKVMCKEKSSGDKKQFGSDVNMARGRMALQNQHLQKMLGWSTQTKKELCSTHHYVKMFYEYPASDLKNEASEKKKAGQNISDSELSNATSQALNGLDYLHSKKLAHGDIRPSLVSAERIGPSTETNQFRLLDRLADASAVEKAQVNNMMNNKELFMSPQLWKSINTKGKKKPVYNRQKNDLFALGMSVISAGNQKSMKDCYTKGGKFNQEKLNGHLNTFKQKYQHNSSLVNVVSNLVAVDEAQRPETSMMLNPNARQMQQPVHQQPPVQQQPPMENEGFGFNKKRTENAVQSGPPPSHNFNRKQNNEVKSNAPPMNMVKKQPVQQKAKIVAGDDFFNNPTPQYQQYQDNINYIPAKKYEPQVQQQYHFEPLQQTEYVQSAPVQTEYVQSAPVRTEYVQQAPVRTEYVQSPPVQTTYVSNVPVQTSYVEEVKSSVQTMPSGEGTITYGKPRVVRTYVDESSRRSFRGENQTESIVNSQPMTTTTYTESHQPTYTETVVNSQPMTTTYTQAQPMTTTYTQAQPTTTYTQAQPTTTYTQAQPTTTYTQAQPTTTYTEHVVESNPVRYEQYRESSNFVQSQPQQDVQYKIAKKKSTVFHDAQFGNYAPQETENVVRYSQNGGQNGNVQYTNGETKVMKTTVVTKDHNGNVIDTYEEN